MPNEDYILRSDAMRCKYTFKQGNGVEIEPIEAVPVSYLQNIPAADVEPVVRCENCQFFENVEYWPDGTKKVCQLLKRQVLENSFCCWGMEKETNDENAEV